MNRHVTVLPSSVDGLLECASYQIEQLECQFPNEPKDESEKNINMASPKPTGVSNNDISPNNDQEKKSITRRSQEELEDALDDGFMCIDLQIVQTKLQKWNQLFPHVKPYFAMKCNPDPMVVKWLASQHNCVGFDVASWGEIQLALEACGEDTSIILEHQELPRLIYANPQRAEQDFKNCLEAYQSLDMPLWLTFDGPEELVKIFEISQEQYFPMSRIGLILRILVPDHHSAVPLGEKFGTPLDDISSLVKRGIELGFQPSNFIGISFHCGSGCHHPETYQLALEMAGSALDLIHSALAQSNHRCSVIDIGGGFPGWDGVGGDKDRFCSGSNRNDNTNNLASNSGDANKETTRAIATAIQPSLQAFVKEGYKIVAEPGRFFVEAAAGLVSKIYDKQILADGTRLYKIAHGVQGVFKDVLLCDESFPPLPLTDDDGRPRFESQVLGPTSSSSSFGTNDVVCAECELPDLQVGDWLVFDRMGAYTLSIASRAGRPVICYVKGGEG